MGLGPIRVVIVMGMGTLVFVLGQGPGALEFSGLLDRVLVGVATVFLSLS